VETSAGLVLIDSGLEADAVPVISQIAELGFDARNVKAILLTHVHADHSQGAARLRDLSGARIYAARADCEPLRAGKPRNAFVGMWDMRVAIHPTPVDNELVGEETITIGDVRFLAIISPGHTPGSVCYLLERDGLRVLFAGDVILHLDLSAGDALGTYAAHFPARYRGNPRDYLSSLLRLRKLPVPDLVLPGHPRNARRPQNPRLGKDRWHTFLDSGISEMQRLLAQLEHDGISFLDDTPRELLPGLHYLGDIGGSAVYVLAARNGLIVVNAPGGADLLPFLSKRFTEHGWKGKKLMAVFLTSTDAEAIGGLTELVKSTACVVVVPGAALSEIMSRCPRGTPVLTAQEVKKTDMVEVRTAIPIGGQRAASTAYHLRWAGQDVLFSGRVPQLLFAGGVRLKEGGAVLEELGRNLKDGNVAVQAYLKSLDSLARLEPALWLPAVPVRGQKARLDKDEWKQVIEQNGRLATFLPSTK